MLLNLFIVNKAGGLVFHKSFSATSRLGGNDTLRLASTFHSLYAIAAQISPVPGSSGIEVLQADSFCLHCFQTLTGIKFFVTADPGAKDLETFLRSVYELYADYVLKNPFYELDQVIKCDLFDIHLDALVSRTR
mmetsp:Transcript_10232/g.20047  ORF Transcript_10232/g.20047 Transcript_10232/m.20047 type:complete len:134 (-) Transcript_10232:206-607(-)|eukprot:CAMPEP_0171491636 /NCGR_PEP_ID=MMETSP0958-20121227/3965_1 /TAXON_ID=87120 /ORGANISM="Aurantiochytrium limacinum, Strain ATCCMYA-1381" /LENGTH=133 /DNA_ID=CAMNT_0012025067 /DNA_START=236 /DNA_END=637 /DNA_ORIENTATION=+